MAYGGFSSVAELMAEQRRRDERLRYLFDEIDDDGNGSIEFNELWKALKPLKVKLSKAALRKQWAIMDADESGSIDFNEFKRLMTANFDNKKDTKAVIQRGLNKKLERTPSNEPSSPRPMSPKIAVRLNAKSVKARKKKTAAEDKKLKKIFDNIDDDGSGTIELDEMWEVVQDIGVDISFQELKKEFEYVDADGSDGISFDEFKRFMKVNWDVGTPVGSPDSPRVTTRLQRAFSDESLLKKKKLSDRKSSPSPRATVTGTSVDYDELKKDDIKQWGPTQVADMVEHFLKGNDTFRDAFIENKLDGIAIFQVNRGFLAQQCGVKDRSLQTRILTGIRRLKLNQTKYNQSTKRG